MKTLNFFLESSSKIICSSKFSSFRLSVDLLFVKFYSTILLILATSVLDYRNFKIQIQKANESCFEFQAREYTSRASYNMFVVFSKFVTNLLILLILAIFTWFSTYFMTFLLIFTNFQLICNHFYLFVLLTPNFIELYFLHKFIRLNLIIFHQYQYLDSRAYTCIQEFWY